MNFFPVEQCNGYLCKWEGGKWQMGIRETWLKEDTVGIGMYTELMLKLLTVNCACEEGC